MKILIPILLLVISGCAQIGMDEQADSFDAGDTNVELTSQVVEIILLMPANVKVDNTANKKRATAFGAGLGALLGVGHSKEATAGGGLVGGVAGNMLTSGEKYTEGVQVTYIIGDETKTSVQVGKMCSFKLGRTLKVELSNLSSRIQPNTTCPVEVKK